MKTILRTHAFTLIELMVVIAIIAILTAIILPNIFSSEAKARDAQRVSDLGQIQLALAMYFDRCGQYPDSVVTGYQFSIDLNATCTTADGTQVTLTPTYISQIPTPPAGGQNVAVYDYAVERNSSNKVVNYILHTWLETAGNPAVAKGLSSQTVQNIGGDLPSGWSWTPWPLGVLACSNAADSGSYCIGPN